MAVLRVVITVALDGEVWEHEHTVIVPPDYKRQDIEPFVLHETDKAMSALQEENFGYSRSGEIIRQFDRRLTLVKALLRRAPHDVRKRPIIERIREVIDLDREQLYARYGREETGD
jgi:hypothetical protein